MKLRQSIDAILLTAALSAVLPVGPLYAGDAVPDTASTDVPRLIDPQSPPASERQPGTAPSTTAYPSGARTPETRVASVPADPSRLVVTSSKSPAEADNAVLNQPAVEDIQLQMNSDVLHYIEFFTGAGRSTFERWLKRSGRYMELFRSVLQKEGLPPDLVHLVFVESGFNLNARSSSAAVGPWQFLRSSAQLFGLNVNQWVDERKDPEKATVAAARYLKHLLRHLRRLAAGAGVVQRRRGHGPARDQGAGHHELLGPAPAPADRGVRAAVHGGARDHARPGQVRLRRRRVRRPDAVRRGRVQGRGRPARRSRSWPTAATTNSSS